MNEEKHGEVHTSSHFNGAKARNKQGAGSQCPQYNRSSGSAEENTWGHHQGQLCCVVLLQDLNILFSFIMNLSRGNLGLI